MTSEESSMRAHPKHGNTKMKRNKKTTTLPINSQNVHMVSGKAFEKFVNDSYPTKVWAFPFQASPVFVPTARKAPCKICEDAIETWLSGINGKHFHVSVTALIRHFAHKGLIPEGNYLVIGNPKFGHGLSDEAAYQGSAKGVA